MWCPRWQDDDDYDVDDDVDIDYGDDDDVDNDVDDDDDDDIAPPGEWIHPWSSCWRAGTAMITLELPCWS